MPMDVIQRLFLRLTAYYGTKFSDAFNGIDRADMISIWAEELAGYSAPELNRGVNACRSLKWPPTLPEFLTLCRPPILPESAYQEALKNMLLRAEGQHPAYSHPAIFWAAQEIGSWDMRNQPQRQIAARWAAVLDKHLNSRCGDVPPPPLKLEAPARHAPTPEISALLAEAASRMRVSQPKHRNPN